MKKFIIALLILAPFVAVGAGTLIKEYKVWDNFASINVSPSNNVNFIKISDPDDATVKCYVAVSNAYTDKAYVNTMSCVKVK